jgi:RNA polymerase sigma factor (sigma-70 family)
MVSGKKLIQLLQENSDKAWDVVLRDYNDYIYTIIRKYVYRKAGEDQDAYQDQIMDTYLYIFEKLSEDNYRRLRSFRGDCKFTTWLTTVCRNLCLDYLAPPEMPAPIKRLSEVHQIAFDLFYRKEYSHSECFGILTINHGFQLSYGEFLHVMDEINATFTDVAIRRVVHYLRTRVLSSLDADTTDEEGERGINHMVYDDRTPEREVITNENIEVLERIKDALRRCLASLSNHEQMLIRLRFWRDQKPRDIAKLMNITAKQASKSTINAMNKLRICVQQQGYQPEVIVETLLDLEIM